MESVIEEEASLLPKLILDKQDDFDAIFEINDSDTEENTSTKRLSSTTTNNKFLRKSW